MNVQTATNDLALHPNHLDDLRRSGLSDETIFVARIRSLVPTELGRLLGPKIAARVQHAYLIPYPEADGFYRVKLFPPIPDKDGHTVRYYQPAGTAPRLYLPPRAQAALADPSVPLLITEGEKKALKADQEGFASAALGGLWSWLLDGQPFPDLDRVDWCEREALVVPDSDVWLRPDLLQAIYAFGKELESRGAKVALVKLPAGSGNGKVGLDDFLCANSTDALKKLQRLPLKHPVFARTAEWWRGWRKKKAEEAVPAGDPVALLAQGETVRVLHPAQEVADGALWYGVPVGRWLVLITSEREAYNASALPRRLSPRHMELTTSTVTREVALAWLGGASGSVAQALDTLAGFFARYLVLRERDTALLLAAWSLGTWCYRTVRVFPYLSIRSPEKRCGKTRLLSLLARVCFNASPVTAHPTEAQLYRAAWRTGGAQLFDEVESLRGDRERFDALVSVLNAGFERGGVVTRLEKHGERFTDVAYEVYAPRALAGIGALKETLADRSLPIFMARKRRDEPVARLTAAAESEAEARRAECALACLTHITHIATAYEQAPGLLEREAVDDRAVDLWSPLVALAVVADAEDGGERSRRLLALARDLSGLRDADADDGQTGRLVAALEAIWQERGEEITPADLLAALQERPGWEWVKTTRRLAGLLNPLGLFREQRRQESKRTWVYRLDGDVLADLQVRYGAPEPAAGEGRG